MIDDAIQDPEDLDSALEGQDEGTPGEVTPEPVQPIARPAQPRRDFQGRISQLVAQRKAAEERTAKAEAELAALRKPAESPQPTATGYTAADVEREYSAGRITDSDRVRYLARLEGQAMIAEDRQARQLEQAIIKAAEEVEAYKDLVPDLMREGTSVRSDVNRAYLEMLRQGFPADIRTELAAVRQVLGFRDKLRQPRVMNQIPSRSPAPGMPARSGSDTLPAPANTRGAKLFARLTPDMLDYYHSIGYDDAAIAEELEYADESLLVRKGRLAR